MLKRTHNCGELTDQAIGKEVTLSGWVDTWRDHGGVVFIDLRDREGKTQIVFNPDEDKDLHARSRRLRAEFVISVKGLVRARPQGTVNEKLKTGRIEVVVGEMEILNAAVTPPFEVRDDSRISEEIRLAYRYLDLRRPVMQKNLRLRHRTAKAIRDFLSDKGFLEVETPILTRSTPEGARDFLVPSRLSAGLFYALPQSPQLFKQILMTSGCDRYFQIAKCFRDEDLRADRQPEFTQLDMEMSFVDEEDIYSLCEGLLRHVFKEACGEDLKVPFPRLSYEEAMARYGTDKPDTRFGMELVEAADIFKDSDFKVFRNVLENGGSIYGMNVKGMASVSRKEIDDLTVFARECGAKGLAYFKFTENGVESPIKKFFGDAALKGLTDLLKPAKGDLAFFVADKKRISQQVMGEIRLHIAERLKMRPDKGFNPLWIVGFPLLKYNEEEKRWESEHHPFTSCKAEDVDFLEKEPERAKARAYDLVINGIELGSGSIRIHDRKMQEKVFKAIGISAEEAGSRFGFLLKAFTYGAPPHGGIAFGLDRWLTLFTASDTIRDVIAFPKTQKGICPLSEAPSEVDEKQLRELKIRLIK